MDLVLASGRGEQRLSMGEVLFEVRVCINPQCGLRYTIEVGQVLGVHCPGCRSATEVVGAPYGQMEIPDAHSGMPECGMRIEVLLDNIRSAWNVGSIFRAADGAGVAHVHLCGVCPKPDQAKVAKTALGAERSIASTYHLNGVQACQRLKDAGFRLWALEGGQLAESIYIEGAQDDRPLLLVVGNEVSGVDPGILALCERVVCLPMLGMKGSLNVAVAFGIAIYTLRFGG